MNTAVVTQIIISGLTFFSSMGGAMFIAGMRWGKISEEITSIDRRLAKIEGMFTLTLKDGGS